MEVEPEADQAPTTNPLFSLPILKRPTPPTPPTSLPLPSNNNTNAAGVVQDDDDQCPSCLGPTVPTPTVIGGGGGKGKGKEKESKAGGVGGATTTELIWISCEECKSHSLSFAVGSNMREGGREGREVSSNEREGERASTKS